MSKKREHKDTKGHTEYTAKERHDLTEKICEIYAQGEFTLESCCNHMGVQYRTFRQWITTYSALADSYKEARNEKREKRKTQLLVLAETALEKRLKGYEVEEITVEGKGIEGKADSIQAERLRRVRKTVPPDSTLIIYALKISDPQRYQEKQVLEIQQSDEVIPRSADYSNLTDDEKGELLRLLEKLHHGTGADGDQIESGKDEDDILH